MGKILDTYTPLELSQAVRQDLGAETFLRDTFFGRRETHGTKSFAIDIVKGKRTVAPFVFRAQSGKIVDKVGYETKVIEPAYINIKTKVEFDDLFARAPGETLFVNGSREEMTKDKIAGWLGDMGRSVDRREELMAAQALFLGYVDIYVDGSLAKRVSFDLSDEQKVTKSGDYKWDNWTAGKSDPLNDLREWRAKQKQLCGLTTKRAVMNTATWQAFSGNPAVTAKYDLRNVALGELRRAERDDGSVFQGTFEEIDVYTYDEWYLDDTGVEQKMVPDGVVLLAPRNPDFRMHYGVIQGKDEEGRPMMVVGDRFVDSYTENDPVAEFLRLQAAPLPVPHQTDAIFLATVL